jgi:integrase
VVEAAPEVDGRLHLGGVNTHEARTVRLPRSIAGELGAYLLRHTCASLLIAQGASVKAVQAQLGHATASITLDTYGHLFPSDSPPSWRPWPTD